MKLSYEQVHKVRPLIANLVLGCILRLLTEKLIYVFVSLSMCMCVCLCVSVVVVDEMLLKAAGAAQSALTNLKACAGSRGNGGVGEAMQTYTQVGVYYNIICRLQGVSSLHILTLLLNRHT